MQGIGEGPGDEYAHRVYDFNLRSCEGLVTVVNTQIIATVVFFHVELFSGDVSIAHQKRSDCGRWSEGNLL